MQQEIANKRNKIHWLNLSVLTVFHFLAVAALFFFSWQNLFVALFLWWLSGGFGIGVGYHRLLTHRGFKSPKWMEHLLTFCGTLALESGPIQWVATHRIHHAFVEVPGKDPHTPRDGVFWSHIGWILTWPAQTHDEATLRRYVPDLLKDPVHVFLSKFYYAPNVLLGAGLLYFGGLGMLLWAVFLRITLGLHFTWMVNSVTHLWGTRPFDTNDDSRNNFLVALVSFGEGWHNHHHAFPRAARHGLRWYQVDFNWYTITVMRWLGLARDIKLIPQQQVAVAEPARELRQAA
jgi:stearoyl-CoA desaturase (delta-9 desaturase)